MPSCEHFIFSLCKQIYGLNAKLKSSLNKDLKSMSSLDIISNKYKHLGLLQALHVMLNMLACKRIV